MVYESCYMIALSHSVSLGIDWIYNNMPTDRVVMRKVSSFNISRNIIITREIFSFNTIFTLHRNLEKCGTCESRLNLFSEMGVSKNIIFLTNSTTLLVAGWPSPATFHMLMIG